MTTEEVADLLKRYSEGKCTPAEQLWVHSWNDQLHAQATKENIPTPTALTDETQSRIWSKVNGPEPVIRKLTPMYRWLSAAAIALIIASGAIYYLNRSSKPDTYAGTTQGQDIPAGSNKAILTLANGKQIDLNAAQAGTIASQTGITITKNKAGQLIYTVSPNTSVIARDEVSSYNTISTPKGGQYQVILPDGSEVYLNAASSLKYPVKFNKNERRVTLSGEAYFEVSKNPAKPFIVESENQSVKVLGTHFNVSGYPGEVVKTTLAEGKVLVSTLRGTDKITLTPNQQAINNGTSLHTQSVNAGDVIAWKDGLFVFTQTNLKTVLQQISRWYDVGVDYTNIPDIAFDGEISRKISLLQMLKAIEQNTDVKLKLEGRRIMIQ